MSSGLFGKTTNALGAAINFRQLNQDVISANIANAETPGYKAKKLDFESALKRAVDTDGLYRLSTDNPNQYPVGGGGMQDVRADVYDDPNISVSNDGNTVDLEKQMSKLSQNTILYKAAIELINKKLATLAYAVTEGGGSR